MNVKTWQNEALEKIEETLNQRNIKDWEISFL